MSAKVVLDVKGLVLAPGELSRASGSLVQAVNVNVEAPGIIRSRNGFAKQTHLLGGPQWKLITSKQLASSLLSNYGSTTVATTLKYGDGSSAWTTLGGTVTNQPASRMQSAQSNLNHYLTSDEGVRRLENSFATLWYAGMAKALALDLAGPTVLSGAPGYVVQDAGAVAYRHTWAKKDAEGIAIEGAPSSRTVVYNNTRTSGWITAVTKNVTCRILIPKEIYTATTALTTAYYWRLYRSAEAAVGVVPSDNMNLVGEAYLSAADITAGYVDFTDTAPEAFRILGDPLYTNDTFALGGENGVGGYGLQQANHPPPRSRDVAMFAECAFYADFQYPWAQELLLLSTVAGTGITAADTITINSVVFTAIAPGTPTNNQFVVATEAAGSSASEALERTMMNLCEAINKSSSSPGVWAYYISEPDKLPGKIRIERRIHDSSFSITVSARGTAYRPSLVAGVTATIDYAYNGLVYSKPVKADACPLVNRINVGASGTSILRIMVLGDSLFVFTTSGLYRLTGRSFENFAVNEFDLTFRLRGRELVCACDDALYAWGIEGLAKITAAGVEYISNAIEPLVQKSVLDAGETWFAAYAWSAAYQSRHKVVFGVPASGALGNSATAFVYDTRMQAWTTWAFKRSAAGAVEGHSCAVVRASDDLLFLGQWLNGAGDTGVFKERRAFVAADYKDDTYDTTDQAITKIIRWNAATSAPELETHWDELHLLYDISPNSIGSTGTQIVVDWTTPTAVSATFYADLASASAVASIAPTATSRMSRCAVPQAQRRSARLSVKVSHAVVSEYFGLEGVVLVHLPGEGTSTVDS